MTLVRFISADGNEEMEVLAPAGARLLDVAQQVGQPLEGTCEGQMACSTCHVIVAAEDFAKAPPRQRGRRRTCSISPPTSPAAPALPARYG
jgi:ferredoxin